MFSVDLYFSFRSPYSYFILPRVLELRYVYGVNINFKLVYPLAIREPHFFQGKNAFTYFIPKIFDYFSQAKKLGMKFKAPKPDPINQNILTGKISNNQPLIFDLCHLGQSMCNKNLGIEFAYEISNSIFGGKKDWHKDNHLFSICAKLGVDLEEIRNFSKINEKEIIKEIENNQNEQLSIGHHGVPLTVYKDMFFFGQDRFNELIDELKKDGLNYP
jgi:2-hydroxychromene-2-carboxylate isomerase